MISCVFAGSICVFAGSFLFQTSKQNRFCYKRLKIQKDTLKIIENAPKEKQFFATRVCQCVRFDAASRRHLYKFVHGIGVGAFSGRLEVDKIGESASINQCSARVKAQ